MVGCLAHGGMGWIYLARDRNVSDRWVVLKGLLNSGDDDAMAAALAERRFLAEVEHPNIVKIFNFVQHESSGYIVMEYVGGAASSRSSPRAAMPTPASPTRSRRRWRSPTCSRSCPRSATCTGSACCSATSSSTTSSRPQHSLKLIDLGGVYRDGRPVRRGLRHGRLPGPEIAASGPSVASDLFTVARTLAVLCFDFRGYQSTYRFTLPPQESVPLLARYDSLYRLLLTGTAPDPDDRFQSAEEMADQLYGVLREVVSAEEGRTVPAASKLFTGPVRGGNERPEWRALPRPQVDRDDPRRRLPGNDRRRRPAADDRAT